MARVYMDYAATTPVREEVLEAMLPIYRETFGNPSSIYSYGREAKRVLEEAREKTAKLIHAKPEEIFFTGSGTEADNWAIKGIASAWKGKGNHIITTTIEHHAVLHTCEYLEKNGFEVTYLPVGQDGIIDLEDLKRAIKDTTILVSIMHANNEIGSIEPIKEAAEIAKEKGILFHTDAVQTVGKIKVDVEESGVDLLSFSAHKIYGPKGVGALYIKQGTVIDNLLHGGAQERKRRPSTENVAGIAGFGKACELLETEWETEGKRLLSLRDKMIEGIEKSVPDVVLNGSREQRLPHNINFSFSSCEGEALLLLLDLYGICASAGSACNSASKSPSHVLLATGANIETAHGSLRFTLGRNTTKEEIDRLLSVLPEIVKKLRGTAPFYKN